MNNNDPNTQTNSNTAFSQHSGLHTQSNPFTGDLKGEFTSDFGTNTNAVSQIFKGGGFTEDRKKAIFIGLAVLLVLGLAFVFLSSGDEEGAEEEVAEETAAEGEEGEAAGEKTGEEATAEEGAVGETATTAEAEAPVDAAAPAAEAAPAPAATGAISISAPHDGASKDYDETQGPAVFEWSGAADRIVFSRSQSMTPVTRSVALNGASSYSFNHPYPGTWFWRVEGAGGTSEVRRFVVNPPVRRTFAVSAPAAGGSVAGTGGVVQWQPGEKVARYQVQLKSAGTSWANPQFRFSSSGTSAALNGVPAGSYDMRVGAFSEVAGRWEWHEVGAVTVQ